MASSPTTTSRQERLVLSRYGTGEEIAHIVASSDLSHDTVNGIIARLASYDRATARRLVREHDQRGNGAEPQPEPTAEATPAKRAARKAAPAPPPPTMVAADLDELNAVPMPATTADGLTALLARADASGDDKSRDLAANIRVCIDALHARLAEIAAEEQARRDAAVAKVAACRAELDAALAELAALGLADVTTTPPSTEE